MAFEAMPRNARFLRHHLEANRCANVEVIEGAASDRAGTAWFGKGTGTGTGRLSDAGELEVSTMTLDDVVAERALLPDFLKIDVEGAEERVLDGAARIFHEKKPVLFLSTHGAQIHARCCKRLEALGYALSPIFGQRLEGATEVIARPRPS